MFLLIKTIRTYFFWLLIFLIFTFLCIPLTFLPEKTRYDNRFYFFLTTIWNKLLLFFTFVFTKIEGEQNLPKYPKDPAIFVINHASALDIILIENIIGTYPHIWLSKDLYGKIPFFNILLKRMHVLVKRENPRLAVKALLKAYNLAKQGSRHLLIFPEGRRYGDGKIHDFLPGFVVLAKKLKRPVIPIAIYGTNKILPKGRFLIESSASDIKINIGKPFIFNKDETDKEFSSRIQDWFKDTLEKMDE